MTSKGGVESVYIRALSDNEMKEIFSLFDRDSDGTVDFKEVATGLYKIRADVSKATNEAMQFFLMLDKDDKRRLDYKQFVRLVLNVFAAEGADFFKEAGYLMAAMKNTKKLSFADERKLTLADKSYNDFREMAKNDNEAAEVTDALKYEKLQMLFKLFDTSDDGFISLKELLLACRNFHKIRSIPVDSTIGESTTTMVAYDKDQNGYLDRNEFAVCIVRFAKINHQTLDEMIDFLANSIRLGKHTAAEEEYMKSMIDVEKEKLAYMQASVHKFKEKKEKIDNLNKDSSAPDKTKIKNRNVSTYVKSSRKELTKEMKVLKARLDMLESLAEVPEATKFEVLFQLMDKDKNNKVNTREFSNMLRRVNKNLSFKAGVEKAMAFIAMYDSDHDANLDREEFRNFLMRMTAEMGSNFKDLSEFILMTVTFSESGNNKLEDAILESIEDESAREVKAKSIYISALSDQRFFKLFTMFDQNLSGTVEYKEVAMGLYKLHGNMDKATQEAMDIFLMLDKNDKRRLSYEQFVELILKVFAKEGVKIFDIIEMLIKKVANAKKAGAKDSTILTISNTIYNAHQDMMSAERESSEVMDALQYAKLNKLFDLYDTSNDGLISLEELLLGCRKFHKLRGTHIHEFIDETTLTMLAYDKDKNQKLDKNEFALCVVRYARMCDMDSHDMIDFLANNALLEENSAEEIEYMNSQMDIESKRLKSMQKATPKRVTTMEKKKRPIANAYVVKNNNSSDDDLWA